MTILVSTVMPKLIVMLSDSARTTENEQEDGSKFNTFDTVEKFYPFPGVGLITTWGDNTGNRFGDLVLERRWQGSLCTVNDLADLAEEYLLKRYSQGDELGFHVGGFNADGKPQLFHVFFGFDRPRQPTQTEKEFLRYNHSDWAFLYNGRNDLADVAISALLNNIKNGQDTNFDLRTPLGRILLCDFVARFAAEITPQVGPPFHTHLIFPGNTLEKFVNTSLTPLGLQMITPLLPRLVKPFAPQPAAPLLHLSQPSDSTTDTRTGTAKDDLPPYSGGTVTPIRPTGIES